MKNTLILGILLSGCLLLGATPPKKPAISKAPSKPNIVLIFTDDLGYGDIGAYGATDVRTPNIDGLAEKGLKFTSFYSGNPVCSPSRAGLLTGRYPRRLGIDGVFFPESYTGLPASEVTVAEALKQRGYATGAIGKWHLGHRQQFLPLQHGFDSYFGIPYSNDMAGVVYFRNNDVVDYTVDQRFITKTYTDEATRFIEQHKGRPGVAQPFFLYLAHNMPHVPLYASAAFEGKSKRGLYGDVIEEIDWSVGEVVNALKRNGIEENTLVIFTSDNGPWLAFDADGGSAGPLREGKQTTFEGGMRVPTVMYWPSVIKPGQTYTGIATVFDFLPTAISLAGSPNYKSPKPLDGEDITPVLTGTGVRKGDEVLYHFGGELQAYRKGDWKIKFPYKGNKGIQGIKDVAPHDTLLFNLKQDVGEQTNLLNQNPQKVRELIQSLTAYKARLEPTPALVQRMPADNSHVQRYQQRHSSVSNRP